MVCKFFDKKPSGGASMLTNTSAIKSEIISNKELAEKIHKPVITKFDWKSTLTFYRQYLGCRSSRYAIGKES